MRGFTLSKRLMLGFIVIALIPLIVLGWLNLVSYEQALKKTVELNLSSLADKKADQINTFINERLADVQSYSHALQVVEALKALSTAFAHGDAEEVTQLDRRYREDLLNFSESGHYYDLLLIDTAGNVVFSILHEEDFGTNLINGPYGDTQLAKGFTGAKNTLAIDFTSFEQYAPSANKLAAFLVAPVLERNTLLGVLALQINQEVFTQVISDRTALGTSGETTLALRDGNDMLFTAPLLHVDDAKFRFRLPVDQDKLAQPMRRALHGEFGAGIAPDYIGTEVAASWRYLPALQWGMVVKIDTSEALAPAFNAKRITLLAMLMLLLLSAGVALWFGRSLSSPINTLTEVASDIAAGGDQRCKITGGGPELKQLASTFNMMADKLLEAKTNLEQQVEERTREVVELSSLQRAILNNTAQAIVATSPDGIITEFNRGAERMLGYSKAEMVGYQSPLVFHDAGEMEQRAKVYGRELGINLQPDFEVFVAYAHRGQVHEDEWTFIRKDRRRLPVLLTVTALRSETGEIEGFLGVAADITERKEALEHIARNREQLNEAQRIAKLGSWTLDLHHNHLEWSDEIYRLFEIDPQKFAATYEAFLNIIHPDDREVVNKAYNDSIANRQPYQLTHRLLLPGNRIKYVEERGETVYDDEGKPRLSRGTVQDITEQKLAQDAIKLYASVFEHSGDAILITNADNHIIAINPAFTAMTGYTLNELKGKDPKLLSAGSTRDEVNIQMWQEIEQHDCWQGELWNRRKNGEAFPILTTICAVRDEQNRISHYVASFTDITERKAAEEYISHLARHDSLTGLYNRFSLDGLLEQSLREAQRNEQRLAVMFIDLDRFKLINDTLGHQVGDEMLVEVAKRLRHCVRNSDIVARLGGDEFVVVLKGTEVSLIVSTIADKIIEQLGLTYNLLGHECHSAASVGISIYPQDGKTVETLMKHADQAMYQAKQAGRNNYQFYQSRDLVQEV